MAKPSIFIVMPYSEPFETVFKEAIKPAITSLDYEVTRADEVKRSSAFLDDIERDIEGCDIVLVEASSSNENVYFELGLARALKKETIIITSDTDSIPSDIRHIRHLVYSPGKLEALEDELVGWIRNSRSYQMQKIVKQSEILSRGEMVPDILDASIYLERTILDPFQDIMDSLRSQKLINPKHIYQSDRGTHLWLKLCDDIDYVLFRNSVEALSVFSDEILNFIPEPMLRQSPDVVSLGPGNGLKDRIFLSKLDDAVGTSAEFWYYYPFDISPTMITQSVREIIDNSRLVEKIKVKAAITDFGENLKRFAPLYQFRPAPNIILLLGNTLGNFDGEVSVLQRIRAAMFPHDLLVLEVRTGGAGEVRLGGSELLNKRFDFNPLNRIGVPFEEEKLNYVQRTNLSQVEGTNTVASTYSDFVVPLTGEDFPSATLTYVHEYNPAKMAEALRAVPFEILAQHPGDGTHFFLLRREEE